jgi:hypothetical protein
MQSPETFGTYFFEEAECKNIYKPITTFYRWYQFSVFVLLMSIFFTFFLLLVRMGTFFPADIPDLSSVVSGLTSASYN